jgi:hypothetical protein
LNGIFAPQSKSRLTLNSFVAGDANAVKDFSTSTGRRRRRPGNFQHQSAGSNPCRRFLLGADACLLSTPK